MTITRINFTGGIAGVIIEMPCFNNESLIGLWLSLIVNVLLLPQCVFSQLSISNEIQTLPRL